MKDDELRQNLQRLRVPEASASARARARHRALIAFEQGGFKSPEESVWRKFVLNWGGAMALLVIMGSLSYFLLQPRPVPENFSGWAIVQQHRSVPENLSNDRKILRQMEVLFPGEVDAVVQKNGKTDLSIAQAPVLGSDQPLVVLFQRGQESIRVLSYSGHRVCIDLGATHNCFDILETPDGGVILESVNKVWLASQHPVVDGYVVRAQTLASSL
jgi:hypothetical protein